MQVFMAQSLIKQWNNSLPGSLFYITEIINLNFLKERERVTFKCCRLKQQ
jgi:hypothetical protein